MPGIIEEKLESIEALVRLQSSRGEEFKESHRLMRRTLYGNGDVGLTERVRKVEEFVSDVSKMKRWFILGVLGLIGKALWDVAVTLLQHKVNQ